MAVRTAYDPTAGEILTATNLEKLAGGWIGHTDITANQGSITTDVDLTNYSVAVTVGPSRRIKITAVGRLSNTSANTYAELRLKEGATQLAFGTIPTPATTAAYTWIVSVVLAPSTGSHTYKASAAASAGTATNEAGATFPGFILVEDIGPAA